MKTFVVKWKEKRTIDCSAQIEAETAAEAIKKAQDYEADVDEAEAYTDQILPGKAEEIE